MTQRCEQIGLFDKMEDLQSAIEESQLDAQGIIMSSKLVSYKLFS